MPFELVQPEWEKLKDVIRHEEGWFQLRHSLAGADKDTSPVQVLFAINHTNTGKEKPPVIATPRKERAVEEDDFVSIPKFTPVPRKWSIISNRELVTLNRAYGNFTNAQLSAPVGSYCTKQTLSS